MKIARQKSEVGLDGLQTGHNTDEAGYCLLAYKYQLTEIHP